MERYVLEYGVFYNIFYVGKRKIYAPNPKLKEIQREILKIIKEKFKIKIKIQNSAKVHCNKKWILKMDLKNFYESVPKEDIQKITNKVSQYILIPYKYTPNDIYKYCTVNDKLPVGGVLSAHIANFAFINIDNKIKEFCKKNNIIYSRYMDDLFFSSSNKKLLNDAENFVRKILLEKGFLLNEEKLKYISNNKRQEILGLLVNNENVKLNKLKKREYRSLFFNYLKSIYIEERLGIKSLFHKKIDFNTINGHLSYIKTTDEEFFQKMIFYIKKNIIKFQLQKNEEINRLIKLLKLKKIAN